MNRKKNLGLLALISGLLMGTFAGCRGYEDGPLVSFRTVKNRLYHEWWIRSVKVDGIEEVEDMSDYAGLPNGPVRFSFWATQSDEMHFLVLSVEKGVYNPGYALFDDKKQFLTTWTTFCGGCNTFPFGSEWNVLRLTHKEIKMETEDSLGKNWVVEGEIVKTE